MNGGNPCCANIRFESQSQPNIGQTKTLNVVLIYDLKANHNTGAKLNCFSNVVLIYDLKANHNLGVFTTKELSVVLIYDLKANHN